MVGLKVVGAGEATGAGAEADGATFTLIGEGNRCRCAYASPPHVVANIANAADTDKVTPLVLKALNTASSTKASKIGTISKTGTPQIKIQSRDALINRASASGQDRIGIFTQSVVQIRGLQ